MRHFVKKAIESLPNMDNHQIKNLIDVLVEEVEDIELLETVLSSLPYGVIVAKPDHHIQFMNIPVRRMLPMRQGDYFNRLPWDVILDKDIGAFIKDSLTDLGNIRPRDFTLETPSRDVTLSIGVMPVVKEGKIQGDFVYVEDVSNKRAEEARLRRAESLASLTTMAAGVAHEIKNPLGSMSIHLQLMQKILNSEKGGCLEEMEEYLSIISEEVERLNAIVVDYLFAVRPMDTHPLMGSLNEIIRELVTFMQYELMEADVELDEDLDEKLPDIRIDDKLMKQALLNIVKNALAAMSRGGQLSIATLYKEDHVVLKISDTGIGIPKEQIQKIFEPYFTTKDNGSGLGLTLVYKVIKEHGGEIHVHSKENLGTTFTILLPVPQTDKKLLGWEGGES